MQLSHAMLFVKDLNRMEQFYSNVLGMQPNTASRQETWVEFPAAHFALHAIPAAIADTIEILDPPKAREANAWSVSFQVADVEAECARLRSLGVQILARPWGARDLVDPEGNILRLTAQN
jgi:catechol 2,3-dioxygenase-like lactoylglutathione lyase family enzyme